MKQAISIILVLGLLVTGVQLYRIYSQNRELKSELSGIQNELDQLTGENVVLEADLEYLANAENLVKEIKNKLNYKNPGEKVIIIVPPKTDN